MTDLTTAPIANDIETGDITMLVRVVNGVDTLYQIPTSVIRGEQGIQGIQGPQGIQGIQGVRGSIWLYGSGLPSSTLNPNVNDLYLNISTSDLYDYTSNNEWELITNIKGIQGIQGIRGSVWYIDSGPPLSTTNVNDNDLYIDSWTGIVYEYSNSSWTETSLVLKGPQGEQGIQGIQGIRGSQWFYGTGTPNISNPYVNDKYLNTSTSDVYTYTTNSIWQNIGNIKGAQGNGAQWYGGIGSPTTTTGYNINDMYLNESNGDVYKLTSTGWVKTANIQGIQGIQGEQGIQGIQGIRGSIWLYGNVSPPTTITNEYDLYLNGLNGDVYQYLSSVWVSIGNIRGPAGTFTNDGSDSITVTNGNFYNSGQLNFYSDGDNTTIDSSIIPSGGTKGTPLQGTLTVSSNIFSVKNQFNSDQGKIYTNGNGTLTVTGNIITTTPSTTDNSTNVATTAYVKDNLSNYLPLTGGILTGTTTFNTHTYFNSQANFSSGSFTDPDNNVVRDAKFGTNGIAVIGGIKTDDLIIDKNNGTTTVYTVSTAAASGVTSIEVTGEITYNNSYVYNVTGTGIASGTQITNSTYDSTNNISTLTLSVATNAALTTTSTISVDSILGSSIKFISNGTTNYDAEIMCVGGGSSNNEGNLTINANSVDMSSSTEVLVPTVTSTDNSTNAASTAYVQTNMTTLSSNIEGWTNNNYLPLTGGSLTGELKIQTTTYNNVSNISLYPAGTYTGQDSQLAFYSTFANGVSDYAPRLTGVIQAVNGDAGWGLGKLLFYVGNSTINDDATIANMTAALTIQANGCYLSESPPTSDSSNMVATTSWVKAQGYSDPCLKDNLTQLTSMDSLENLDNINLYSFDWKDDRGHVPVGFNSKNLLEVWPDVVSTYNQVEGEEYKPDTINFLNLIARLTGCIKELKNEVNELKNNFK